MSLVKTDESKISITRYYSSSEFRLTPPEGSKHRRGSNKPKTPNATGTLHPPSQGSALRRSRTGRTEVRNQWEGDRRSCPWQRRHRVLLQQQVCRPVQRQLRLRQEGSFPRPRPAGRHPSAPNAPPRHLRHEPGGGPAHSAEQPCDTGPPGLPPGLRAVSTAPLCRTTGLSPSGSGAWCEVRDPHHGKEQCCCTETFDSRPQQIWTGRPRVIVSSVYHTLSINRPAPINTERRALPAAQNPGILLRDGQEKHVNFFSLKLL